MEFALVWFAVLLAVFFFFVVRPQRRRMMAHQMLLRSLQPGDAVVTTGGIHGTLQAVRDDTVELEVAPQIVLTVARGAVAHRVAPDFEESLDDADGEAV